MAFNRSRQVAVVAASAALALALDACDTRLGRFSGLTGPVTGRGVVTDSNTVVTVTVSPSSPTISVGTTQSFSATAKNSTGKTIAAGIVWLSSGIAVATIDGNGTATAVGTGTTTISAVAGNVTGKATLTVR